MSLGTFGFRFWILFLRLTRLVRGVLDILPFNRLPFHYARYLHFISFHILHLISLHLVISSHLPVLLP